nr:hypothetical protein [Trichormus azollae]
MKTWADTKLYYEYLKYPVDAENAPSRGIVDKLGGQIFSKYKHTNLSRQVLNVVEYRIRKQSNFYTLKTTLNTTALNSGNY